MVRNVITGTGCFVPPKKVSNLFFSDHVFYDANGTRLSVPGSEIIKKFREITCINERRYVSDA